MQRELIKVVCVAVSIVKEGDRVIGEENSQPMNCYSPEDCEQFYHRAAEDINQINIAEKPTRRSK